MGHSHLPACVASPLLKRYDQNHCMQTRQVMGRLLLCLQEFIGYEGFTKGRLFRENKRNKNKHKQKPATFIGRLNQICLPLL